MAFSSNARVFSRGVYPLLVFKGFLTIPRQGATFHFNQKGSSFRLFIAPRSDLFSFTLLGDLENKVPFVCLAKNGGYEAPGTFHAHSLDLVYYQKTRTKVDFNSFLGGLQRYNVNPKPDLNRDGA